MFLNPDINDIHKETRQSERLPKGLREGYVKLDGRTLEDLVGQCAEFSRFLRYYDAACNESGDWHEFFDCIYHFPENEGEKGYVKFSSKEELDAIIADRPHLALLVSFLHLFGLEQDHLNTLTEKHLEYYYNTVLGFVRRTGKPGTVPVCAQLAKNTQKTVVPAGTRFAAGKDCSGREIFYKTKADTSVVSGAIGSVYGIFPGDDLNRFSLSDDILSAERTAQKRSIFHRNCQSPAEFGLYIGLDAIMGLKGDISLDIRPLPQNCTVYFTSGTGWEKVEHEESPMLVGDGLLAPFSEKVHGPAFGMTGPVLKIVFDDSRDVPAHPDKYRIFSYKAYSSSRNGAGQPDYAGILSGIKASVDSLSGNADVKVSGELAKYVADLSTVIGKAAGISSAVEGEGSCIDAAVLYFSPAGVSAGPDVILTELKKFSTPSIIIETSGIQAGDTVSIYFRMDQTLCDITSEIPEDGIRWFYLSGEKWNEMQPSAILSDTTEAMTHSGTVTFRIPEDASGFRLRLLTPFSVAYPCLEGVYLNVLEIEYDPSSEGSAPCGTSLPAGTITKPEYAVSGVKAFTQIYPGEAGTAEESRDGFLSRVSERLRHKDRAVDLWDYERLILEKHPSVAAVKCISCTGQDGSFAPGSVNIVLVPDVEKIPQKNPLQPQVDLSTVKSVTALVREKCSPFVRVSVSNPKYQAVQVRCTLKLKDSCADTSHALNCIREKLTGYLSPWNGGEQGQQGFDKVHNTSRIAYFIESMDDWVDHILSIQVYLDGVIQDGDIVPADESAALTSVPASEHMINVTEER